MLRVQSRSYVLQLLPSGRQLLKRGFYGVRSFVIGTRLRHTLATCDVPRPPASEMLTIVSAVRSYGII